MVLPGTRFYFFFLKLNELRKGKFKASFLGRSVKAKFKVKNLESSKEKLSGLFSCLAQLDRGRVGGANREGGREGGRKKCFTEHAQCSLSFFILFYFLPLSSPSLAVEKLTVRFHLAPGI